MGDAGCDPGAAAPDRFQWVGLRPLWSEQAAATHRQTSMAGCAPSPLLEGERTYGRHREIDAIDPQATSAA
jgi:hypothetical protein